jgi:STIP1 family protein 1
MTRCINVIYRARDARASYWMPYEYMCPISLDWYCDPVVTPDGQSFSKQELLDSLQNTPTNPVSRKPLQEGELYPNLALAAAVEHYRRNHQLHGIVC